MARGLTSLEVIGMAVRSETDAARFYTHVAKLTENELVREKYISLAREEVKHREMLVVLYKEQSGEDSRPPKIPGTPETAEGGPVPTAIEGDMNALLKLAVQREKEAALFYRDAALATQDLPGKRMFEYLARIEKGHQALLEDELDAFGRDKEWYLGSQWQDMMHVGP